MLKFQEWLLRETITLPQAIQLYGYKAGDVVTEPELKQKYRALAMQHHPDRQGDPEIFKNVTDGRELLARLIGNRIPAAQQQRKSPQQKWVHPIYDPIEDIRNELTRAIEAVKRGQPEDAFGAVSRLVDPYTGKLNNAGTKPLLKTSLDQWLTYYKQGFHDYLIPILTNALKLI